MFPLIDGSSSLTLEVMKRSDWMTVNNHRNTEQTADQARLDARLYGHCPPDLEN